MGRTQSRRAAAVLKSDEVDGSFDGNLLGLHPTLQLQLQLQLPLTGERREAGAADRHRRCQPPRVGGASAQDARVVFVLLAEAL